MNHTPTLRGAPTLANLEAALATLFASLFNEESASPSEASADGDYTTPTDYNTPPDITIIQARPMTQRCRIVILGTAGEIFERETAQNAPLAGILQAFRVVFNRVGGTSFHTAEGALVLDSNSPADLGFSNVGVIIADTMAEAQTGVER